jgi:FAD/FMN-containing dehydrogenase
MTERNSFRRWDYRFVPGGAHGAMPKEDGPRSISSWATEHKVPLTPRGKASSGYGGVLPIAGALEPLPGSEDKSAAIG